MIIFKIKSQPIKVKIAHFPNRFQSSEKLSERWAGFSLYDLGAPSLYDLMVLYKSISARSPALPWSQLLPNESKMHDSELLLL